MSDRAKILIEKTREVLKKPELSPADETPLARLPAWDSIKFMNLLVALEKEFGFRFNAGEIAKIKTWGEFRALVERKTAA